MIVSMLNFSLAFCIAVIVTPVVIFINAQPSGAALCMSCGFCLFLNPLVVTYLAALASTLISYAELKSESIIYYAFSVSKEKISDFVVDSIVSFCDCCFSICRLIISF